MWEKDFTFEVIFSDTHALKLYDIVTAVNWVLVFNINL